MTPRRPQAADDVAVAVHQRLRDGCASGDCAAAASARWTKSRRGACSTPTASEPCSPRCPRGARASADASRDDRRLVLRFRLAVRVSAERAARRARAADLASGIGPCCSPDCSARTARRARRRFPRSARSPIASCVWQAKRLGHRRSSFRPSIRSIRCRCCGSRSRATASADAVHRIFRFVWRDGRLPDLPIEWAELVGDARRRRMRTRASRRRRSRTSCAATPTRRSRAACSACRRWRSATSCSGAPTRPRWRADYVAGRMPIRGSRVCARRRAAGGRDAWRVDRQSR